VLGIKDGCERQAAIAVKRLELFLLETICTSNDATRAISTSQSSKNYATVVRFLEANLGQSLSVAEIARACNMSEVNLKKTFSRYAGMGVMQYFNRLKIYAAIELLRKGSTVREAAEAVGFSNQNYFCKVFTRIMERPPKHYKN
jgi:transcriptional regulator GlxA family with amidase domain